MEEETVVVSVKDLLDYAALDRKRTELKFKRDFLLRNGAKGDENHVQALSATLSAVEDKLAPLERKLKNADLLTPLPHKQKIDELSKEISKHSAGEIDQALVKNQGPAYEKMRERSRFTATNFKYRGDIARLTILLNTLPRHEGEKLKRFVEQGGDETVDLGSLSPDNRQELVNLLYHIGFPSLAVDNTLRFDQERAKFEEREKEVLRWQQEVERVVQGQSFWVSAENAEAFDRNEQSLAELNRKIQARNAEKQVRTFNDEEQNQFTQFQQEYLKCLTQRDAYLKRGANTFIRVPRRQGGSSVSGSQPARVAVMEETVVSKAKEPLDGYAKAMPSTKTCSETTVIAEAKEEIQPLAPKISPGSRPVPMPEAKDTNSFAPAAEKLIPEAAVEAAPAAPPAPEPTPASPAAPEATAVSPPAPADAAKPDELTEVAAAEEDPADELDGIASEIATAEPSASEEKPAEASEKKEGKFFSGLNLDQTLSFGKSLLGSLTSKK